MKPGGAIELVERVARGGMADLFLGSEPDGTCRLVKTVRGDANAEDRVSMARALENEALFGDRVSHPRIPALRSWWREGDTPFLVFDFIFGWDLARLVKLGGIPGWGVRGIGRQTLDILEYLNELSDIVHRDISPENLILDVEGRVHLVDFGLSAEVSGETGDLRPGRGKLRYAAPEQWRGGVPDVRSDLYSLSIVLWELISRGPRQRAGTSFLPTSDVGVAYAIWRGGRPRAGARFKSCAAMKRWFGDGQEERLGQWIRAKFAEELQVRATAISNAQGEARRRLETSGLELLRDRLGTGVRSG